MRKSAARLAVAAAAALGLLAGLGAAATAAPVTGAAQAPPAHFVIIMMENHGLQDIVPNAAEMPYLNSLWSGGTSLDFTRYYTLGHPSLPNYLGITSGFTQATSDSVRPGQYAGPSVWDQLSRAGVSWGVYEEGMPSACYPGIRYNDPVTNGQYVLRHDPGVAYGTVYRSAECKRVRPLRALRYSRLPAVTFITPNICDDMHGLLPGQLAGTGFVHCVIGSAALKKRSDHWLSRIVPKLTAAGATVFIAFDECCGSKHGPDYAVETGAGVRPRSVGTHLSHYSVLAAIERAYGLPLLGGAATARPLPLG